MIYKQLFNEASFSPQKIVKILTLFNKVLEKRTKKQFYGNPNIYEDVQNGRGKFHVITYQFGTGLQIKYLIAFNVSATISYIDFYLKPYSEIPTFQSTDISQLNIIQLVDLVTDVIVNKKSSELPVLIESRSNLKEIAFNLKDFANNISGKESAQGLKLYFQNLKDFEQKETSKQILSSKSKDFQSIFSKYNSWAKKYKKQPYGSLVGLTNSITRALIKSGLKQGVVATVSTAKDKKSKSLPMAIDTKLEMLISNDNKYRGTTDQKYTELEDLVRMVSKGQSFGLLVAGDPGLGKTFRVNKVLKSEGLSPLEVNPKFESVPVTEEVDVVDDDGEPTGETETKTIGWEWKKPELNPGDYLYVKGKATPKTVYGYAYMCGKNILVFDDSKIALTQDPDLIKALLENNRSRKVDWNVADDLFDSGKKSLIPSNFMYQGKVIFLTNKYFDEIDSAVVSRSNAIEINFTADEVLKIIKQLLPDLVKEINKEYDNTKVTIKHAQETYDFCVEIKEDYSKLDLRTFQQAVVFRFLNSPDWKRRIGSKLQLLPSRR